MALFLTVLILSSGMIADVVIVTQDGVRGVMELVKKSFQKGSKFRAKRTIRHK